MKRQMFFAGTTCEKVTENTVVFQISTVRQEIVPTNGSHDLWERLRIPVVRAPKRLMPLVHPYMGDYPCRVGHVDIMCGSLCSGDSCFSKNDLTEKLSKVMMAPTVAGTSSLVAVTIIDGRIVLRFGSRQVIWTLRYYQIENRSGVAGLILVCRRVGGQRMECGLLTMLTRRDTVTS